MMEKKIAFMVQAEDMEFYLVRPKFWKDEYGCRDLRTIERPSCPVHNVRLFGSPLDPHRTFYGTFAFSVARIRPHIIHIEEEPDSLAALHAVYIRRFLWPQSRLVLHTWQNINRPKKWHVREVLKRTLNGCDVILCAHSEGLNVLREIGYGGRAECVMQEGIDTAVFHPPEKPRESDRFVILYAGRFSREKGIDTLLEAVSMLPDSTQLVLVGGGDYKSELIKRVASCRLEKNVSFLAPQDTEMMVSCYHNADVLVLPSLTTTVWKEQFGRVLVEAMACRLPVVGSDSGAIPEVIGDGGLIFCEGDAGDLARSLRLLMTSEALRTKLGHNGYKRAHSEYSQEVIAGKTVRFYRTLMEQTA